jgi:NDP-sugar pyrophosphorylase family protein
MKPMASPTLLILAAGMGNRYGGIKLVEPVGPDGETILDYSIYDALRAGFGRFVFVIRPDPDIEKRIKEKITARFGKHLALQFIYQQLAKLPPGFNVPAGRTRPWGTTHAILMAASAIHEPFAVINSDDFYGADSYRALAHHLVSGTTDYAVVGYVLRNTLSDFGTVARAVCQVSDNRYVESIVELKGIERQGGHAKNIDAEGKETMLTGSEIVSMNMWGFTPQVFDQLHDQFQKFLQLNGTDMQAECYIPSAVNELLAAKKARVKVIGSVDSWFGVTYREDYARAVESVRSLVGAGYYPKRLHF